MTLTIDDRILVFTQRSVFFSDRPRDVTGVDAVRFPFCSACVDEEGFSRRESPTAIIDLRPDLDALWKGMDRKSTRYAVQRAEKEGIEVRVNAGYDAFYAIQQRFVRDKGYRSMFGAETPKPGLIRKYGTLFVAEHQGEILGGHVYLEDADNILLWVSASRRLEVDKEKARMIGFANTFLHWEAMKYAKAKGIREFNWGGLFPETEVKQDPLKQTLNAYKLHFGGVVVTRYSYHKVYSPLYQAITALSRGLGSVREWFPRRPS
ncbi:MAG: GNAT family N-acetyltransferase [Methanomicrobiales archaeon]|nr:GNAT family N-acetyltransferase [Methanomicrobiales archaeon]